MRIERSIDWFEEVMGRPGYTAHVMSAAASDVTEGLAATLMPGRSYEVRVGDETVHDDKRLTYRYTRWIDVAELVCRTVLAVVELKEAGRPRGLAELLFGRKEADDGDE